MAKLILLCNYNLTTDFAINLLKKIVLATLLSALVLPAWSNAKTEITVGGSVQMRELVSMEFDGDNVVLTYTDGQIQKVDMSTVSVKFLYDETALENITIDGVGSGLIYNLNGQCMGTNQEDLPHGIYIINGKKVVIR